MKQSKIQLTLFNAKEIKSDPKVAYSKTYNKKHIFANIETSTLKEAFSSMKTNFVLSQPLNLSEPTYMERNQDELSKYKYNKIKNIVLDLDKIHNKEDYFEVIEYFKKNNYSCILGKSRSWNGKDNFNIKGIIRVNIENTEETIIAVLLKIQAELGEKCKVDRSMASIQSYQAPTNSGSVIYYKEDGVKITGKNIYIENIKKSYGDEYELDLIYNNDVIDECIKIFSELGYFPIKNSLNTNGSINFKHFSEVKTPGGFFWFSSQPLVMNHPNKDRSISIFNILKDTEVGKLWLKDKTKIEQKRQLIVNNTSKYKEYTLYNERYLDFTDERKINTINNFLDDKSNSILKLKSPMGTAKSNAVSLCIEEAHKRNKKVIIISNRVSVAKDFSEKYGVMWYRDMEAWKEKESLVVQFDSLHRFDIAKYDIVILDEFISLLFHHRSNLTENSNINIAKFMILLKTKKVMVADAFLTGFEDIFFENRDIRMIDNNYKDNIKLIEYKHKEKFIKTIIENSKLLETNSKEKISCSFTSNDIMKTVNYELKKAGVKVIMLNAETPEHTRNLIYEKFKEEYHKSYDVILYSPTLTVGVSNLNNIKKHFHYDSGMSTDVISSLQMIKRSRKAQEIHYFLEERQFYMDTDIKSINTIAEKNISTFYNNKSATLLIEMDFNTGNLRLTELAKYVNKIEAFYNITRNNHANAFKILLNCQFSNDVYINEEESSYNLQKVKKNIKEIEIKEKMRVIKDWSSSDFNEQEIEILKSKSTELSEVEKMNLLVSEIQKKFKEKLTEEELKEIVEEQIKSNFKFLSYISKLRINNKAMQSQEYSLFLLSQSVSNDISSLQNKGYINFLKYLSLLSSKIKLKNSYSEKDIRQIDEKINAGTKFKKYIKSIGYIKRKGDAKYRLDERISYYSHKL